MSFEFSGFDGAPFLDLPPGPFGYVLVGIYALGLLAVLAFQWPTFRRLNRRQWLAFAGLTLLGVALAQLFILHIPANILPPPGVPTEPQRPGFALFALVPAFLAGGWLGVGPALLVGFATGLARALWETYSLVTPFDYAIIAGMVAWCVRQDYRGWPSAILRHPAISGPLAGLILWIILIPSYFAYSDTTSLPGWDYVASLVWAAAPVFIGEAVLAGVIAELAQAAVPTWWPQRRGLAPPPYLASLNRKLLFTLIPLFCLGITLLFWADITIATRVSANLVVAEMARAAQNAGREIPVFAQTGSNLLSRIADQGDWFKGDSLSQTARLSESMRSLPFFRQLTLFDSQGRAVAGYPLTAGDSWGLTGDETSLVDLARTAGIPQNTTVYTSTAGVPVEVLFTAPIKDANTQKPVGVLLGRTDLVTNPMIQSVTNNLEGLAGGAGEGFIVDDQGVIIYHPDPAQWQQKFEPNLAAAPVATALSGASAYEDRAPDGTRQLVLVYPAPGYSWSVVIRVPHRVVLELATQISTPIVVIMLLIGLIGLILVSLIASRITRPAEALAQAAQRISDGRLDQPVVVEGEDEIGRAGLAFERMRARLRARLDELNLLLHVSQGVASSLNLTEALPPILQGALNASGAAGVRIILVPNEELPMPLSGAPPLHQAFAVGSAAETMSALDRGVLVLTRDEGRAVIENLARARAVLDVTPVFGKLHALIALPLRQEHHYYGALWLGYDQPHPFTEAEVNFLTTLAGQAAVAVANARLFEVAEQGRQRLAAILASTPDAVIVTDWNARILLLNPAAEAVFELSGRPVIGRVVGEVLPTPELVRLLQEHSLGPATGEFETASGRTLYASASPIISADGSVLGQVCVLRDVTHFKELDLMKSEFVATVSHDLRAPLTFMRGYATMMPMVGPLNEKQQEFAAKIITGIEQMTKLIDDLLDLGRIEAGVGLAREACQLDEIVHGIVDTLKPAAMTRGLALTVDVPENLPVLSGDATLLRQAISNLLDNAIKYTPSGGQVRVIVSTEPDKFRLAVADTGLGIAPADQTHLFQKFFRVKQRGSTQVKGSGLGLAIVKSIVERHGGRVWVDSKLGKGSTFYMELPPNGAA
jgi:two-component system, OmpR family, phosphate regulon sensor histidine kinase PhoR